MQLLTLLVLGSLAGALMKLTDDIEDRKLFHHLFALPSGLAYGLIMGYLMLSDGDASLLFGGMILGCLLAGKINARGHYFGLSAVLALLFLYGAKLSPVVFPVAAFAALDELKGVLPLHDIVFDYRLFLKLGIVMLVILDVLGLNALIILIAFDSAYMITEKINSRFL